MAPHGRGHHTLLPILLSIASLWNLIHLSALTGALYVAMTKNRIMVATDSNKGMKNESGQMVLKTVEWTYFDAYI